MDLDARAAYRALATRDPRFDGRLFAAVRTTGVYCRPVCPARTPKREHVTFFPTAAAAQEAGYRPCLRCRPETAPDLSAWRGTSNTVARALRLIEAGGLDEGDVETMAERLGLGERQLRRLFRQHLGASPIAVAQTRRVLLAKQLIHETSLPMSEVALASGYGSIRRFNETFQRLFQRPPGALRRGGAASSARAGEVSLQLRYRPPYDWPSMLAYLRARAVRGIESVDGDTYSRTMALDGHHGIVTAAPARRGPALDVTVRCPSLTVLPAVIARVRRVFDLAADPQAIVAQLGEEPLLAPLVAARPGLRVPGAWDGFELVIRAILGQQISVGAATALAAWLVGEYGEPLAPGSGGHERLTHLFPSASRLAAASTRHWPMPRARAAAITSLARTVAAEPDLFAVGRTFADVVAILRGVKGIGDWTVDYVAMRELREPDAFPADDVALRRALAGPDGRRPTADEVMARAERWRPWRAYAAQHLWTAAAAKDPARSRRPSPGVAAADYGGMRAAAVASARPARRRANLTPVAAPRGTPDR